MAFTTEQETKLLSMLEAFESGMEVNDLPSADMSVTDKLIEVYNQSNGQSERMQLRDAVNMANSPYCGRVWNEANGTPKASAWEGSLEMLRQLPDILKLGCYLVQNDHSRRKLDPTNHYRFATGEPAKLDGSMGHYNWGWGVKWYYADWKVGTIHHQCISLSPIPGQYNYEIPVASMSATGFASIDRNTSTLVNYINEDVRYRGGNNDSSLDGTNRTLCGKAVTSMTCEAMRAAARKNGSGWLCGTMRHSAAVKILFEIIFGTRNAQAGYTEELDSDGLRQGGFGTGVTNWNWSAWGNYNSYRPFLPQSVGVELADNCGLSNYEVLNDDGTVAYTAPVPCFFGLKNFHGYLWRHQDDEFGRVNEDTSITHLVAPSIYGTWTIGAEAGMVAYSTCPKRGEGYIVTMSYDHLEMFPTSIGGSETTYHCDYFWNTSGATSGFRLVLRGCNASHGGRSGPGAVYVHADVAYSSVYIGSPLCEAEEEWSVVPQYAAVA